MDTTQMPEQPEKLRTRNYDVNVQADILIPNEISKLKADIEFDMFSIVQPGYGLGANNKMFLQEAIRDEKIINKYNYFPRPYDGPTGGPDVVPTILQNVLPKHTLLNVLSLESTNQLRKLNVFSTHPDGATSGVLGLDVGFSGRFSEKLLPRPRLSCLEPIFMNTGVFESTMPKSGFEYNSRPFRNLYDPLRDPESFNGTLASLSSVLPYDQTLAMLQPLK
jgi:hypothetical protein